MWWSVAINLGRLFNYEAKKAGDSFAKNLRPRLQENNTSEALMHLTLDSQAGAS
jgi:hypothetical protein